MVDLATYLEFRKRCIYIVVWKGNVHIYIHLHKYVMNIQLVEKIELLCIYIQIEFIYTCGTLYISGYIQ